MTGPVVCARHDCGRDWRDHGTGGLPATGCRGFLWVDPAGPPAGYSSTAPSWPSRPTGS